VAGVAIAERSNMKIFIVLGFVGTTVLAGCATSRDSSTSTEHDIANHGAATTLDPYSSVDASDSIHAGGTWKNERDSVKSQVALVTLAIIIGAMIVLALTMGTAGRGG